MLGKCRHGGRGGGKSSNVLRGDHFNNNNNELYFHDHTSTYSIAKAMFRNQNYNTGQLRYFDNKRLRSAHFGVVVVELINCKCGGIVRNEIW